MKKKRLTAEIQDMAQGGYGVARYDGKVYFIPEVLPQEKVLFEITQEKKSHGFAKPIEIVTPSKERRKPLCPYFGVCGGCHLQQTSYERQLTLKQKIATDTFQKISGISLNSIPSITPSPNEYGYRNHIRLRIENRALGFQQRAGAFLPIKECPLFIQGSPKQFARVQNLVDSLSFTEVKEATLRLFYLDGCFYAAFSFFPKPPENFREIAKIFFENDFKIYGKAPRFIFPNPKPKMSFKLSQKNFYISPYGFMQNQVPGMQILYSRVLELLKDLSPRNILDLYCGSGILTILIAEKLQIPINAIELNSESIDCAKLNQSMHGATSIQFQVLSAEAISKKLSTPHSVALVNPPREGLTNEIIEYLTENIDEAVIYISCHPATLARDAKRFKERGFVIDRLEYFDLFPQTYHVESVLVIKKPA